MTNAKLPDYAEIPVNKLKYDTSNARKHGSKDIDVIKYSLTKFGQTKPIVVTRDHTVVAGNGTLRAARALGFKTIKVIYTDLQGEDLKAYALVDNQSALLSEWDIPVLGYQLQELGESGWDITALGFGLQEDRAPEEEAGKDKGDRPIEYLCVVQCEDENEQRAVYEQLRGQGLACKIL